MATQALISHFALRCSLKRAAKGVFLPVDDSNIVLVGTVPALAYARRHQLTIENMLSFYSYLVQLENMTLGLFAHWLLAGIIASHHTI